ncbi:hypothetical protein LA080_010785 [Diaporthe eres]|nr:hypothetical protein LA080_010785 [Diaporthe eres]
MADQFLVGSYGQWQLPIPSPPRKRSRTGWTDHPADLREVIPQIIPHIPQQVAGVPYCSHRLKLVRHSLSASDRLSYQFNHITHTSTHTLSQIGLIPCCRTDLSRSQTRGQRSLRADTGPQHVISIMFHPNQSQASRPHTLTRLSLLLCRDNAFGLPGSSGAPVDVLYGPAQNKHRHIFWASCYVYTTGDNTSYEARTSFAGISLWPSSPGPSGTTLAASQRYLEYAVMSLVNRTARDPDTSTNKAVCNHVVHGNILKPQGRLRARHLDSTIRKLAAQYDFRSSRTMRVTCIDSAPFFAAPRPTFGPRHSRLREQRCPLPFVNPCLHTLGNGYSAPSFQNNHTSSDKFAN